MKKNDKIFVAGHRGLVGSAVVQKLKNEGYDNLILKTRNELDLINQAAVAAFFQNERPDYVILAAAHVGGILANLTYQANFLYDNLMIQSNVIWNAHQYGVKKLLFLGGKLESTNEGYAIAKIAGMKLCEKIYEQYSKQFISCMPTNVYGTNDNFHPEHSHVIPGLIQKIHAAMIENKPE